MVTARNLKRQAGSICAKVFDVDLTGSVSDKLRVTLSKPVVKEEPENIPEGYTRTAVLYGHVYTRQCPVNDSFPFEIEVVFPAYVKDASHKYDMPMLGYIFPDNFDSVLEGRGITKEEGDVLLMNIHDHAMSASLDVNLYMN